MSAFDAWSGVVLDGRYAWRRILRAPWISSVTIACIALGIGLDAAMFAIVDDLLLRPPPYVANSRTLRYLQLNREMGGGRQMDGASYRDFRALSAERNLFDAVIAQAD